MLKRCAGFVSLVMAGALLAPSPSSADTGSGWTAPTKLAGVAEPAYGLTASSSAVAYSAQDGVVYRKAGATDSTVLANTVDPMLSGASMIVETLNERHDPSGLEFIDLNSGATSTAAEAPHGGPAANLGGISLASACCTNPTNFVLTHADATTETITIPVGFVYGEAGSDANGFAFWSMNAQDTKYVIYYYDLTTRTYRELQRGDGAVWGGRVTVTQHDIVWLVNDTVYRTPRAGGAITQANAPGAANTTTITATDNLTAFLVNGSVIVRSAVGDSTANLPSAHVITTDGTNVLVGSNADVNTAGVYQVSPTGQVQELFPLRRLPYRVGALAFSQGRLYYSDNSAAGSPWFSRPVDGDTSTVNVGGESRIGYWPWNAVTSGDRIAYPQKIAGVWHVRVLRNGRLERDFVAPSQPSLQMSGPHLVMSGRPDSAPWWAKLADITTGSVTTLNVLEGNAAVWGPLLVYVDKKDNLWRRDLTRPASSSNPRLLMTPKRFGHSIYSPQILGDWVEWNYGTLMNTRTGERVSLTFGGAGQLADGGVVWYQSDGMDTNSGQWMAIQLSGTDRSHIPLGRNVGALRVVEDKFAWIDSDPGFTARTDLIHVDELPFNGTDVARTLYLTPERTFTPNGKRHYVVELDSTKALRNWSIEIHGPHGALVKRWTGSSLPSGVVKVGWDGTNGGGHRVAAGTYTVKATGAAADGSGGLRRAFGSKLPVSWIAVTYPH